MNGLPLKNRDGRVGRIYNNTTAKAKGTGVFPVVRMVLAFLSKGLPKASRDKTENNIMQMKYLKDSF